MVCGGSCRQRNHDYPFAGWDGEGPFAGWEEEGPFAGWEGKGSDEWIDV